MATSMEVDDEEEEEEEVEDNTSHKYETTNNNNDINFYSFVNSFFLLLLENIQSMFVWCVEKPQKEMIGLWDTYLLFFCF